MDELEHLLVSIPHRIILTAESGAACSGYGRVVRHECAVETYRRICVHCRVPEDKITEDWCPVNTRHVFRDRWRKLAAGVGGSREVAIGQAVKAVKELTVTAS